MSKHGWNYRVIRTQNDGEESFDIHEVYYDETGRPWAWSEEPSAPHGDTLNELLRDLELQHKAFAKPVLEVATGIFLQPWGSDDEDLD